MQQPQPQPQHHVQSDGEKQYWEHLHQQVLNRVQITPHTLALSWLPSGSGGSQRHLLLPLAGLTHVACASATIAWPQKLRGTGGRMDRLRRFPALAVVSALLAVASLALWLAAAGKREAKLAPAIAAVQALLLLIAASALRRPCAVNTEGKKRSRCATALIVLRMLFVVAASVCAFLLAARAAPCRKASSEMPGFFCQSPANATTTTTTTTTGITTTKPTGTTPTAPASTPSTTAAKATNATQAEDRPLCGLALCDDDMQPVLFALFAFLILQAAVCVALCFHAVVVFILARKPNDVNRVNDAQIAAEESVCVSFYGSLSGYDWRGLHVTLSASAVPELTAALDAYRFAFVPKAR